MYVYLWPIHVDVWQKPTQYCKAIILQLKIDKLKKKRKLQEATLTNKQEDRQPDSKAGRRPERAVQPLPSGPGPHQSPGKLSCPGGSGA